MPRVSIIIPTYNRAGYLTESVQSVLDQSFGDFELIVVDDGSTDNTKEAIESFKDPHIRYIYQENRGISAARNTGIKHSSGEYVAFLDSDDLRLPRYLEKNVELLDSRPDIGIVFSDLYVFESETESSLGSMWKGVLKYRESYLREIESGVRRPLAALFKDGPFSNAFIVRRQVLDEAGYYDESLPNGNEDFEFYVRVLLHIRVGFVYEPLGRYRIHSDNLSGNCEKMYQGRIAVVNKLINDYSFYKEYHKLIRRRLAWTHCRYGWEQTNTNGGESAGREKLLEAIGVDPWWPRPYYYLILSLLGSRGINTFKSWKKRLKHR
jgi:glycosyltransferase involved in cell wall biosynthesis